MVNEEASAYIIIVQHLRLAGTTLEPKNKLSFRMSPPSTLIPLAVHAESQDDPQTQVLSCPIQLVNASSSSLGSDAGLGRVMRQVSA